MTENDQNNYSKLEIEALKRKERLKALKRRAENDKPEDSENDENNKK